MDTIYDNPVKIESIFPEIESNACEDDIHASICFIKKETLDFILEKDVQSGDSCVAEVTFNVQEPTYLIAEDINQKGGNGVNLDGESKSLLPTIKCKYCRATFTKNKNYKSHLMTHTSGSKIECNVCFKTFPYTRFVKHVMVHTGERPHVCKVCGRGFRLSRDLKQHSFTHTGERPYPCDFCGKKFADSSARRKHYQTHTGEKPYSCEICQRAFTQISHLREHQVTHTKEKVHNCEICEKKFTTKSSMQRHTLTHLNCCDICGESFTTNIKLEKHKELHNIDRPYSCPHCSKRFLKKTDANTHLLCHTNERNVFCNICNGSFKSARYLRVHHSHYHKGMDLPFMCHICNKGFYQETGLTRHSFAHVLKTRVKCSECKKVFSSCLALEKHICEKNDLYYHCENCDKKYRYKSDLNKHNRKFHNTIVKIENLD